MLLAIGDVHGHLEHLDALVDLLRPEILAATRTGKRSELILIGDYVAKGPDSLGVLRRAAELPRKLGIPVHALRGNHDQHLTDLLLADDPDPRRLAAWVGNGGAAALAELGIREAETAGLDPSQLVERARTAAAPRLLAALERLQPYRRVGGYVFVHAGVHPERPLADHEPHELLSLREPFLSARDWRQPFVVVHGHTIRGPEVQPHRIAIDSGAYRTGVLTALQLEDDRLRFWCVTSDPGLKAFRRLPGLERPRRFTEPLPLPKRQLIG
jgi:serine/threonine protein phosphatase 1